MADRLRPLWDFADLDASEARFREQLEREVSDDGRAEVLTQLARVHGLRGEFAESAAVLARAEPLASSARTKVRLALERGRMLRSSGDRDAALPVFEAAFERAVGAGEHYFAGDAAHMAALAAPDRAGLEAWTANGLELGEREPDAAYWAGPLLNNLGWAYSDAGENERALETFRRALEVRERDPLNEEGIAWARYAVAHALRALGRGPEAVETLEPAVAWSEAADRRDAYFHQELAEGYAAAGRSDEAREQARLALALVDAGREPERAGRLGELAAE